MKKTAIYVRVSTDKQAKEGDSVSAQLSALKEYVRNHKNYVLVGEYIDDGVSGTKFDKRNELQRLLDDVKKDAIDIILFTRMDRWFRSVRHYSVTQDILDQHHVDWVAIWEPIYDTTTPAGRLIVNQMMAIAQFEAENTGQRIKQVFAYKRQKGEVLSGRHPFGYKIENKHLVPVPEQVDAVKFVFDTYRQTSNLGETLRKCAGTGAPTEKMGLKKMLKNEIYIGVHNGKDDFCEPIISKEDFAEVQRLLKINYKSGKNKHEYIFSGIIRCGCCGHRMSGTQTSYKKSWYRCATYWNSVKRCENKTGFSERMMEEYLLSRLRELIGAEMRARDYEIRDAEPRSVTDQINALTRKRDRLKELYINELITIDEYRQDRDRFTQEIEALQAEQPAERDLSGLKALLEMDIESIYKTLETPEKRRFWRGFIDHIVFNGWHDIRVYFL